MNTTNITTKFVTKGVRSFKSKASSITDKIKKAKTAKMQRVIITLKQEDIEGYYSAVNVFYEKFDDEIENGRSLWNRREVVYGPKLNIALNSNIIKPGRYVVWIPKES